MVSMRNASCRFIFERACKLSLQFAVTHRVVVTCTSINICILKSEGPASKHCNILFHSNWTGPADYCPLETLIQAYICFVLFIRASITP